MSRKLLLVFSDLDGSLLDHHTYSFEPAEPVLMKLRAKNIPLVLVSSKTSAEISQIRRDLNNQQAFIVENGAGVFLPKTTFPEAPQGTIDAGDYWCFESVLPRTHWLELITEVGADFNGEFEHFYAAGVSGIQRLTGLSPEAAALANERDYSEPVAWQGDEAGKLKFVQALEAKGATVQQGGRFLSVSGQCDKGQALLWLKQQYQQRYQVEGVVDIAIGDSANDCAMLEVAQTALVIKSPSHPYPPLKRQSGIIYSQAEGPAGWAEGVAQWLSSHE